MDSKLVTWVANSPSAKGAFFKNGASQNGRHRQNGGLKIDEWRRRRTGGKKRGGERGGKSRERKRKPPPQPPPRPLVSESNPIGLVMICDSTQSAVTAEASSRWLERGPWGPLSGYEIRGGWESRVNVSECETWHLYCLNVCACLSVAPVPSNCWANLEVLKCCKKKACALPRVEENFVSTRRTGSTLTVLISTEGNYCPSVQLMLFIYVMLWWHSTTIRFATYNNNNTFGGCGNRVP